MVGLYIYIYILLPEYIVTRLPGHHTLSHAYLATIHCHKPTWPPYIVTRLPGHHTLSPAYLATIHCHTLTWPPYIVTCLPGHHTLSPAYLATIHFHTTAWPTYIVTRRPGQYLKARSNGIRAFSLNTSRPISVSNGILVSISTVLILLSTQTLHRVVDLQSSLDATVIAITFTTVTTPTQILQHLNSTSDCIV